MRMNVWKELLWPVINDEIAKWSIELIMRGVAAILRLRKNCGVWKNQPYGVN